MLILFEWSLLDFGAKKWDVNGVRVMASLLGYLVFSLG